jgi:hypothetical protein
VFKMRRAAGDALSNLIARRIFLTAHFLTAHSPVLKISTAMGTTILVIANV